MFQLSKSKHFTEKGKRHVKNMSKTFHQNTQILHNEKCDMYEVIEWPEVLSLPTQQLRDRIYILKHQNIPVSVGHIKQVTSEADDDQLKKEMKKIEKYKKNLQGKDCSQMQHCLT